MDPFIEQHQEEIGCVLSCFDRVVVTGTLPDICHDKAMASYLGARDIRLFDNAHWAEPLREDIRTNAERLAAEAGLEIEFVRKLKTFRKEDRVQSILAERGDHPGLVHIFSAMESCSSYRPWHEKVSGKTLFKPITGKCLHYYFRGRQGHSCIDPQRRIPLPWHLVRPTNRIGNQDRAAPETSEAARAYRRRPRGEPEADALLLSSREDARRSWLSRDSGTSEG